MLPSAEYFLNIKGLGIILSTSICQGEASGCTTGIPVSDDASPASESATN